jgi:DNA-binding transcriptional LysR family regulator
MPNVTSLQLGTILLFCKAAELGGFTAAAKALSLTPAAVSRGVCRLEVRLGVKLFRRTTRSMQLTDDGRLYYEQCRLALGQLEEAEKTLLGDQIEPKGLLRISAASTYAHYRLLPRLTVFKARYPLIELEINVSNRNVDFVEEGYDVVIRLGEPPDSRLVARKLEDAPLGVYASSSYLKKQGEPSDLQALQNPHLHTLLPFVRPSTGRVLPWLFNDEGLPIEVVPHSAVKVSEEPLSCVMLACSGMGLVQTFEWVAKPFLALPGKDGLQPVLTAYAGRSRPFYLLYPHHRHLSTRVRTLVAFLGSM